MFEATTHGIRIQVQPSYIQDQSDPAQSYYFFSYHVRIENTAKRQMQLVSRHWLITDGFGQMEEVEGPGVIGVQPILKPGESFEYSSFCPLTTPTGSMRGTYFMVDDQGTKVEIEIPTFILAEPNHYH